MLDAKRICSPLSLILSKFLPVLKGFEECAPALVSLLKWLENKIHHGQFCKF